LTWSFGWTIRSPISAPAISAARLAITSLAFMFEEVPEPVWNTSTGNWSSWSPAITSSAAATMTSAVSSSTSPRSRFACAAAFFTTPSARTNRRLIPIPEIGKFSTARWVCAPQYASAGTCTSPRLSASVRNSSLMRDGFPETG